MTLKTSSNTSQFVMNSEFTWNFDDTMVNTASNTVDFGKVNAGGAAGAFDVIQLPPGAVVVGGSITIETAFDTAGYDVIIGDSGDTDRYFATADLKGLGITALTPSGYHNVGGLPVRVTFASDDVCTTGKATLRVEYVIDGRVNEQV